MNNKTFVILGLYEHCKVEWNEKIAMIDKKDISYCLAIQIIWNHFTKSIKLSQEKYILVILAKFNMINSNQLVPTCH
jgi:hypothetical protein